MPAEEKPYVITTATTSKAVDGIRLNTLFDLTGACWDGFKQETTKTLELRLKATKAYSENPDDPLAGALTFPQGHPFTIRFTKEGVGVEQSAGIDGKVKLTFLEISDQGIYRLPRWLERCRLDTPAPGFSYVPPGTAYSYGDLASGLGGAPAPTPTPGQGVD
jgi:hypothetical protein